MHPFIEAHRSQSRINSAGNIDTLGAPTKDDSSIFQICREDTLLRSKDGNTLTFVHRRSSFYFFYLLIVLCVCVTIHQDRTSLSSSLYCVKHPRESNSTYHEHEDVDCTLKNNTHVVSFEFADVSVQRRVATRHTALRGLFGEPSFGVFLLGSPRTNAEYFLLRWYRTPHEAVEDAQELRLFLNRTKHEAGLLRLHIVHDTSAFYKKLYLIECVSLVAFWFLPVALLTTFDAGLDIFVQEQKNIYSMVISRLSFPLERVSFCHFKQYDAFSVRPQAGAMQFKKNKEFALSVVTDKGEKYDLRMGRFLTTAVNGMYDC